MTDPVASDPSRQTRPGTGLPTTSVVLASAPVAAVARVALDGPGDDAATIDA